MESLPSEYASLVSDGEKRDAGRGAGSEAKASETPRPQEAREQPADPMPSVVSLLLQARGQDPFRAATLVLEMAQKTAEARLQESERLAAQIAKDAEATIARAQLDLEARRKAFDEDLVRRERAFAEDLDRRSKAQEAVLAARSAELDRKERTLEQQTSAAQKDLEERRRQHDARWSAELEANRQKMAAAQKEFDEQRERYESRMSAELEAHRNRITAESTQHQQLLAKERAEFREQLRREAEVQAKVFDVQQAALARDLQLSQGLVQERQAQAKALLDTADLTSGTVAPTCFNAARASLSTGTSPLGVLTHDGSSEFLIARRGTRRSATQSCRPWCDSLPSSIAASWLGIQAGAGHSSHRLGRWGRASAHDPS